MQLHSSALCASGLQGSGESGQAEAYMCAKVKRSIFAREYIAEYLGTFIADANEGGFSEGTQWLLWKYESDTTLAEACQVWDEVKQASSLRHCLAQFVHLGVENERPSSSWT